jgi:hypothetical protein
MSRIRAALTDIREYARAIATFLLEEQDGD